MYSNDKNNIRDMLSNSEAQYNSVDNAIEYVRMINPSIKVETIIKEYSKYIRYCINNDLI
jgi:hypothetical protein